jgi:putative endonuclease
MDRRRSIFLRQAKPCVTYSRSAERNKVYMETGGKAAYFCYIVQCLDKTYYTGWTTDPQRRTKQHNKGTGAKYTRTHRPVTLVYFEELPGRSEAMKREYAIKAMSRKRKEDLIQSHPISTGMEDA